MELTHFWSGKYIGHFEKNEFSTLSYLTNIHMPSIYFIEQAKQVSGLFTFMSEIWAVMRLM